ncbi:hypothetical protein [uncultured Aliivibrio sp.]|uniref:hypothetical protein n=1 Tax=uncultured Aliivibrio sp. TaxID=873085 RepID=UPI002602BD75|nr:hypothetical protein [uncultured Aliivibrio sp.]
MKKILTPLAIVISLALSSNVVAEDFIAKGDSPALDAVSAMVEEPFVQAEINEETYVSAEQQILEDLNKKGWSQGWDANKKRLFVVNTEMFDSEDPSYDDSFITKRSQYAMMATMGAKAKMVEFMRTQMSAVDQLTAPGTDVHAELNAQYVKLNKKVEAQQRTLEKLLAEVDAKEAAKLTGVTWQDRRDAYIDALIKKIDESYSAGKLEDKKIKQYQKAKQRYVEAQTEMSEIMKQASAIKGKTKLESTSRVETLAKAPIMGASVLLQAESWNADEEKYEVSTLMVWSPKLEQAAKAIVTGEPVTLKPKKALTVQKWLQAQEAATLVGPRQYVDKDGDRWFIGAYSMPVEGSSSLIRKNKGIADLMAKKEAAMALYADVETQKQAEIAMQTRSGDLNGKDHTAIATSFAETTRQSIENRQVNGLSPLFTKTVLHPISQQKIYVVAYGISSSSASEALKMEYSAYQAASSANKSNKVSQAVHKTLDTQLEMSKTSPVSANDVEQEIENVSNSTKSTASHSTSSSKVKSNSSSLLNAPTIDEDDF